MAAPLHTYHDGSTLRTFSAKELIRIPIWQGNRILDSVHAATICRAIHGEVQLLDSGYRIVEYDEEDAGGNTVHQSYLIDGQHRASVLRAHFEESLCEPDFTVTVVIKKVSDESEAIAFFNALNNCKPQLWRLDPNLIVNKYIADLTLRFNVTKKLKLIRPGATHRPYLSVEKLRDSLRGIVGRLSQEDEEVSAFVERVYAWNRRAVQEAGIRLVGAKKDVTILEKSIEANFMLAFDGGYGWIEECL